MEKTLFLSSKELPPNYIFANDKVKMIESLKKAHRDCYKTTNALNECVLGRKKVNFTEILHIATTHFFIMSGLHSRIRFLLFLPLKNNSSEIGREVHKVHERK